jgi:hypothetical protein
VTDQPQSTHAGGPAAAGAGIPGDGPESDPDGTLSSRIYRYIMRSQAPAPVQRVVEPTGRTD